MHTPGDWTYDKRTRMVHAPNEGDLRRSIALVNDERDGPLMALAPELLQLLIDIRKPLGDDHALRDKINRLERRALGYPV